MFLIWVYKLTVHAVKGRKQNLGKSGKEVLIRKKPLDANSESVTGRHGVIGRLKKQLLSKN
jgi:hypothetical protein